MKLCDRCFESGDYVKATNQIIFDSTDEHFDLCTSCSDSIREFINDRTRRTSEDVVKTKE
jgi:hypothetical protein